MIAELFWHSAPMSSQSQHYAARVLAAFEAAGLYTDDEIKAAGGPSSSTMTKLRKAAEGDADLSEPRGDTHRRVEMAARWQRGASRNLWHHQREPAPLDALPDEPPLRRAILENPDIDDEFRAALLALYDARQTPPQPPHQRHQSA